MACFGGVFHTEREQRGMFRWSFPQGNGEAAWQVSVEFSHRVLLAILALQITLGRATREQSIDVDLSLEGPAWKISRRQGVIKLRNNGDFFIANEGKRPIHIDGKPVLAGNKQKLFDNSVVEVGALLPCYPLVITIPVTKRGTLDPPCPSTSTSTKHPGFVQKMPSKPLNLS